MRTIISTTLLCMLAVAANLPANASEPSHADIVTRAFEQVEWNPGRTWAYTQTGFEDETLIASRFDPSRAEGDRWTLLAVDNRPPTVEEIDAFLDEKQSEQALPEDDSDVPDMIELESLQLTAEDDNGWVFSFKPMFDGDEADFADKMAGELRVSKSDGALQYVDIANTRSIRPGFGVKIRRLHMRFEFAAASDTGPRVISEIRAVVKGGAYLLVSIDEQESTRFSDFVYVGDAARHQGDRAERAVPASRK